MWYYNRYLVWSKYLFFVCNEIFRYFRLFWRDDMDNIIFFDNASTTKIDDSIMQDLNKINDEYFYNCGALYKEGRRSHDFLESCRSKIKHCINADDDSTLVFTGSATEANNMALLGVLKKNTRKVLVSMGEHPSVYNTALEIKARGYNVEFVNLDKTGKVDIDDFKNKMTTDVDLVSIMYVSNETGAINNIKYLVEIAKEINPKVIFHCDAVQALGKIDVDVEDLGVDMLTMSAHKIHGCKGVGALYVQKDLKIKNTIFGGGQELGLRSGTENILGVYTFAKACEIAENNLKKNYEYVLGLKRYFLEKLESTNIKYFLNSFDDNSPYVISISFKKCRAETLLYKLNDLGVCVGNGSACSSKKKGNRILENMGLSQDKIEGNLRISFSRFNTVEEIDSFVEKLEICVNDYLNKAR